MFIMGSGLYPIPNEGAGEVLLDAESQVQEILNRLMAAVCKAINNTIGDIKVDAINDPFHEIPKCAHGYSVVVRRAL